MDDLISKQAVLNGLASIAKNKAKSDAQKALMGRTMFFVEHLPSAEPVGNTDTLPNASCPYFDGDMCRRVICQSVSRG